MIWRGKGSFGMFLRPDNFLELLYKKNITKYSFNAETEQEWETWRNKLKKALIERLGGFPEQKVDLNPRIIEEADLGDYIRQRVVYTVMEGLDTISYVLIPKNAGEKLPAVVACHGHGYGSKEIVGLKFDGSQQNDETTYQKNFALELVKRGFFVIAPELLGFGDRTLEVDGDKAHTGHSSCYHISVNLLMYGMTMAGMRVYETMRTIDYLFTRSEVNTDRIGCMGISGGGLVCSYTSAVDERIKAAVVSGYVNSFKDSIMSIYHCIDNFVPGMLKYAELPDIIGLIAPRPLLVESGTKDPIFPIDTTEEAFRKIEKIYNLLEAKDKIDKDIFEGEHEISGAKAYDWFMKWL
ncbi:MAG: dienelactone hydrolase family protein [Caldicoprobacteraceae bacterium]|jgi:dienelactone hydrolase